MDIKIHSYADGHMLSLVFITNKSYGYFFVNLLLLIEFQNSKQKIQLLQIPFSL